MTPQQAVAFVENWLDSPRFAAEALTIRNKQRRVVPLVYTPLQARISAEVRKQERAGLPVRGIALKPRQAHASVGVAAEMYHRTAFFPGHKTAVVAHLEESAAALLDYYEQFDESYRSGPGYLGVSAPAIQTHNSKGIAWKNGSEVRIATANNVDFGRSFSAQNLHLSEFAYYRDADAMMGGLINTLPYIPGTMAIIESTANGMGNAFHQAWLRAKKRGSGWFTVFYSWLDHPEYQLPVSGDEAREIQHTLDEEERVLVEVHHATIPQIAWRRMKLQEPGNSVEKFHQEFPTTAEEAFLTSGRPRFDTLSISRQLAVPALTGDLRTVQVGTQQQIHFLPKPERSGQLHIWRKPEPRQNYVLGADVAKGIDVSARRGGASDPDYSVAHVFSASSREQVAKVRERMTPATFGEFIFTLGKFYNWAYLVCESNSYGVGVIETLLRLGYPVERLYAKERDVHDLRPPMLQELGYESTVTSKPQLIHYLDQALRETAITVNDENTIAELLAYSIMPDGSTAGSPPSHDDEVIAAALSVVGLIKAPQIFAIARQPPVNADAYQDAIETPGSPAWLRRRKQRGF